MKLVITTPEMLAEILKSTVDTSIQEFYSKKNRQKPEKNITPLKRLL